MRILQILEATGGGTARHVIDLTSRLSKHGVEVHLAYSPLRADSLWVANYSGLVSAGVKLVELPMRRAPHPSDLQNLGFLHRYLLKHGPFDLVHGHSSKGGGLARLLRFLGAPRSVYTPHAFITQSPGITKMERLGYGLLERSLSLLTNALIAVSLHEAQEAIRLGYPQSKVHVIPNGIELKFFSEFEKKDALRWKWGVSRDSVVVGFIGRFSPQKAPSLLLKAFSRVATKYNQAYLVMVGDGPLRRQLQEEAQALSIEDRVIWPGYMPGRQAMHAFDIFALSSNYEGFPYVLLEAMAAGLPVVATRVGGTEMTIAEGENGFVVPVGDVDAFAKGLAKLIGDEVLRKSFGRRSLERVKAFSIENMVKKTLALYHDLAGKA